MNLPKSSPEQAPGHYGAGYGEQVPADAPPSPAPRPRRLRRRQRPLHPSTPARIPPAGSTGPGDDGNPVVFTPDDVTRPPA